MRIVYIGSYKTNFPSRDANSIHIMRMCEAMTKMGHEVHLIVSGRGVPVDEIFESYGILKTFKLKIIKTPIIKGKTFIYSVQSSFAAKSMNPDIIISRAVPSCLLCSLLKLQVVYDSHGPIWIKHKYEFLAYKLLIKNKNLIRMTTNSHSLKNMYLARNLIPSCGVIVAHNGSSEYPLNDVPADWPGSAGNMQIGYIGHLYSGRGVEIIIACAEKLPQYDFHLVGGTDEDINRWRGIASSKNLFFHGFIKHSDVYRYRNKCDVLLAPYSDKNVAMAGGGGDQSRYMNPIKVIEYMSSKKAIICSDIPALREVLDDESAFFVSPSEIDEWVKAIIKISNKELRSSFANNAFKRFKNALTWEARAQLLIYGN